MESLPDPAKKDTAKAHSSNLQHDICPIQNSELNSRTQKKVCRNKTPSLPKRISYFELDPANVQKIIMMLGKKDSELLALFLATANSIKKPFFVPKWLVNLNLNAR